MGNWRLNYLKAFLGIIGVTFLFAGFVSSKFLPGGAFNLGNLFLLLGLIVSGISFYWWYKDLGK